MLISLHYVAGQVPCAVRGVHEHGAGTGADPLQPADPGGALEPAGHPQGHQGPRHHVRRAGGHVRQHDGRQGSYTLVNIQTQGQLIKL